MTDSAVHDADQVIVLDRQFMTDPHATYEVLRRARPVTRAKMVHGLPIWLITRYDDVRAALTDPRLAKDSAGLGAVFDRLVPAHRRMPYGPEMGAHMLNSDPPQHSRLRALVNRGFTSRSIGVLRPRIEAIAEGLADALAARLVAGEELDLIDAFSFPLPMTVICEILGVPAEHRSDFRKWSNMVLSSAPMDERAPSFAAMAEFLMGLVADKRAHPGDDMLSTVVAASEDADQLTENEAVSMAFLLLVAGHDTTVNLISNGVLALLRNPEQLARLRADPTMVAGAVEEFLRFDGPLNLATMRFTAEPVTIAGTEIPAGELVLVSLASANRDPDRFSRPDELDLSRGGTNLAFGHGIHHCLGAALARLEGQVALRALLDRVPPFELAAQPDELVWRDSTLMRGLTQLPIRRT
ncbi:MAG TPA: cytochrome P450 [Pseudonocardia sp.]|jgi:cytochrome P450|nr:cytochrome P450 [Pseudonocardia sp.]